MPRFSQIDPHPMPLLSQVLPLLLVVCLMMAVAGCGLDQYEARLKAADGYYSFLERQNAVLDSAWRDPETGIEFRPPKQLKLLPSPAPPTDENPGPIHDPRQPDYLEAELPELIAAWQGVVTAQIEGQHQSVPAYLYMMSNIRQLQVPGAEAPADDFFADVVGTLCQALKLERPEQERWEAKNYPSNGTYAVPKTIDSVLITPPEPINGFRYDFYLYEHRNGEVAVSLLFVIPAEMNRSETLSKARTISLETLSVPAEAPPPMEAPSDGAGSAPPRRSSGF